MNYESAPATKLVATLCACCGKNLLDAESVEAGMGPVCRKKHGYVTAQMEPDWREVLRLTESCLPLAEVFEKLGGSPGAETQLAVVSCWHLGGLGTRRVANLIVYRIACRQEGPDVLHLAEALRALGFTKLSERIAARLVKIRIRVSSSDPRELVVVTPNTEESIRTLRAVPGRRWDPVTKTSRVPITSKRDLHAALVYAFPGAVGLGPKGLFSLGGACL